MAEKYGIDYIIDDGLLIQGTSIVAGKSAKREKVYISAVRTALFDDPLHRHEVTKAVRSRKIRKILLLGTSERMAARCAERLNLPPPSKVVFIEEISSQDDIRRARRSRDEEGKHVIPVPSIEVERDHPHLISNSIKVLSKIGRGFGRGKPRGERVYEKSVVRPSFDGEERGKVAISRNALGEMIAHCVDEFDGELIVKKVKIKPSGGVYHMRADVQIPYQTKSPNENLRELRDYVVERIERFTGIIIAEFDLVISSVSRRGRRWVSDEHPEADE